MIPWVARWFAELLSKHAPGHDGKTQSERIRDQRCKVPFAIFGGNLMYVLLKAVSSHDKQTQRRMRAGMWLGVIERAAGNITCTKRGAVKCRTVKRFLGGQRRDFELVSKFQGLHGPQ